MSKQNKPKLSRDQRLLNNFYDFSISQQRLKGFEVKKNRMIGRYFLIGLGFGIFYETLIVKTSIYQNIIKKSTLKRLEAKRVQNNLLLERKKRLQDSNQGSTN